MSMTGDHGGATPAASRPAPAQVVRHAASRWTRGIAELPRWIWFAAVAVAAVAIVVAAMGGFARAEASPTLLGADEEVRTSQYAITVLDAEFATEVESEYLEAEPGEKLLVMSTRMENLSDAPIGVGTTVDRISTGFVNTGRPLLDLAGVPASDSVAVWRADGSSGQVILQPGVPSQVTFAWTIPEDAFLDGSVALDVHEVQIQRGAVILSSRAVTWRPAALSARISVTAQETR
ncbi:hypothetical protein SOM10_13535 [Microbacterium sp. CFBP9023]|uniref:hypothetical protein n=1 Tax=unclassified Microbacterium TaxID=2609290 RepID=UPI00069E5379|nr:MULTISPECIES: hypothetical protein [unclassified Microbacterium]AKV86475.1 hypothetical protein AKG07_09375 [Microbacterium sp. CGR1]MDY0984919.1 hypothetical protein [Microbacterium sp. CFBP9023]